MRRLAAMILKKRPLTLISLVLLLMGCNDFQALASSEKLPENEAPAAPAPEHPSKEVDDSVTGAPNPNKNPGDNSAFKTLPNGKKLSSIKVRGSSLRLVRGSGASFSNSKWKSYLRLKEESMGAPGHKVQWAFMDLDNHQIIARSTSAHKKIFGASSSKIYVAATLLDKQNGELTSSQLQKMADMLVVSSNTAWTSLQKEIGDGSANLGREKNYAFTQRMGYPLTRGFQGYWGSMHGNELTPDECVEMLYDTFQNNYPGAETLWKLMYTSRTGSSRGKKYIPSDIYVGGKTGTYHGPTENPETGKQYTVNVRNHLMVFNIDGLQYGLAVLANSGSDESAALLAGGLIREYAF